MKWPKTKEEKKRCKQNVANWYDYISRNKELSTAAKKKRAQKMMCVASIQKSKRHCRNAMDELEHMHRRIAFTTIHRYTHFKHQTLHVRIGYRGLATMKFIAHNLYISFHSHAVLLYFERHGSIIVWPKPNTATNNYNIRRVAYRKANQNIRQQIGWNIWKLNKCDV